MILGMEAYGRGGSQNSCLVYLHLPLTALCPLRVLLEKWPEVPGLVARPDPESLEVDKALVGFLWRQRKLGDSRRTSCSLQGFWPELALTDSGMWLPVSQGYMFCWVIV
jgi:hypothetical protein